MVSLLLTLGLSISFAWIFSHALDCPSSNIGYRCVCDTKDNSNRIGGWSKICFSDATHRPAYVMDYLRSGILKINCDAIEHLTPSLFLNITKVNRFSFINCKVKDSFYDLLNGHKVTELLYESSNQDISAIFDNLNDLKVLILARNKLNALPLNVFSDLTSLDVLNLNQNELVSINDSTFSNLQNLVTLSLSRNRLIDVQEDTFKNLKELKSLYMSRNSISNLSPSLLSNLSSLEVLDVSYNQIYNLSEEFLANQVSLKRFYIHYNKLSSLPPSLFKNTVELVIVDVSSNSISTIPEDLLQESINLNIFSASFCQLNSVPHNTFVNNSNLKEVKLNRNRLEILPKNLFKNALELKKLDLSENPLNFIFPEFLASQTQLEWLSLARCNLSTIPEDLFASTFNLKYLDISSNKLTHIEQNVFMNLVSLVDLNLKNNMIQYIGDGLPFGRSSALKRIDLSRNHLNRFPDNIQWQIYLRLESLNLRHNILSNFSVPLIYSEKASVLLGNNNITTISVQELLFHQDILDSLTLSDKRANQRPTFSFHPNPIKCDCLLYNFAKMATSYFRIDDPRPLALFPLATHLICHSPSSLKGRTLSGVANDEFRCNVETNCPKTCSCYQRAFDGVTVVDCQSRGLTEFPKELPTNASIIHLENNSFSNITPITFAIYENCTEIYLSGNKIQFLEENLRFSRNLKRIALHDNRLTSLLEFIDVTPNRHDIQVTLSGNPYQCDCNEDILKFLFDGQTKIKDLDLLTCTAFKGFSTRYIQSCFVRNKSDFIFWIQTVLFIVLLIILCCILAIFIHRQYHTARTSGVARK